MTWMTGAGLSMESAARTVERSPTTNPRALQRISRTNIDITELDRAPAAPQPSTAEVRTRARSVALEVPDRGWLRLEIWQAWHDANAPDRI
jgi:hypothetical protein